MVIMCVKIQHIHTPRTASTFHGALPDSQLTQEACHKLMDWSYQYTLGKSYPLLTHWVLVVKSRGETTDIILPTRSDQLAFLLVSIHLSVL